MKKDSIFEWKMSLSSHNVAKSVHLDCDHAFIILLSNLQTNHKNARHEVTDTEKHCSRKELSAAFCLPMGQNTKYGSENMDTGGA